MSSESFYVAEIFASIQGEGWYAGYPHILVRFSGCNLECTYCDTPYARKGGVRLELDDIMRNIKSLRIKRVLITGGEPILQTGLMMLVKRLLDEGLFVSVETNGTLPIRDLTPLSHIIMDIKTPGSGMDKYNLYENLKFLKEGDEVKFVLTSRADYEWSKEKLYLIPDGIIVDFSPAYNLISPKELAKWILRDRLDVKLHLQLHKILWGDERGR